MDPAATTQGSLLWWLVGAWLACNAIVPVACVVSMIGLGGQRCGAWTANISSDSGGVGLLYQQWIYGFLSSSAERDLDLLKEIDGGPGVWL